MMAMFGSQGHRHRVFTHSDFEHCALCAQPVKTTSRLAFALYKDGDALAYLLCDSCTPKDSRGLSELQLRMLDLNLDVEAERIGLIKNNEVGQ